MKRSLTAGIILLLIILFSTFLFYEKVGGDCIYDEDNIITTPLDEEQKETMYYTEDDVEMLAKLLYAECRGVPSETEKACVAWVVLNRVDNGFAGETIHGVITQPKQFASIDDAPVTEDLYNLASDVLSRWNSEKNGKEDVGRVLPHDYTYFSGDGQRNHFRNKYNGGSIWDFSIKSPYES